jgi:multidrug efflux pump subunit AcrB
VVVSIPVSVVLCLIFFYLAGMSFNIISLAGLIIAVGLMVDNSIIAVDNIGQFRKRGFSLRDSCVMGVNEIIVPLITSALTTVCIFIPLIFLSGIAGALFFDQAMGVAIGLGTSLIVAITLIPVLYRVVFWKKPQAGFQKREPVAVRAINRFYNAGMRFTFRRPLTVAGIALVFCIAACILFQRLEVTRLPELTQIDGMLYIDWNEQIHPEENNLRIGRMLDAVSVKAKQENRFVGQQQFLIHQDADMGFSEAQIYLAYHNSEDLSRSRDEIAEYLRLHYPQAAFRLYPPATLFDRIFGSRNAPLVAALSPMNRTTGFTPAEINALIAEIDDALGTPHAHAVAFREHLRVEIDHERMLLYSVNYNTLIQELRTACREYSVGLLRSHVQFVPMVIGGEHQKVSEMFDRLKIRSTTGAEIPIRALARLHREYDLKTVTAGRDGEYVPMNFNIADREYPAIADRVRETVNSHPQAEVRFFGGIFENRRMLRELFLVLAISILMLYFILAAEFESLVQPLILLIELPIDIGAMLFLLWITGNTLNLMSAIGIIVVCGIIINDSILKIDTINRLRREGMSVDEALHTAGSRRLKAIVLTSLPTILAVLPLLLASDMGAELQRPFAWVIIGGMGVGTLVSLFVIPLVYGAIYKDKRTRP